MLKLLMIACAIFLAVDAIHWIINKNKLAKKHEAEIDAVCDRFHKGELNTNDAIDELRLIQTEIKKGN